MASKSGFLRPRSFLYAIIIKRLFWLCILKVLKRILLQKNIFPPWIFLTKSQEQNEEELGLIIDLTYTCHYYKPELGLTYFQVLLFHHKIGTELFTWILHGAQGPVACREQPVRGGARAPWGLKGALQGLFFLMLSIKNKLIGIHWAHGVNRTGYHICRFTFSSRFTCLLQGPLSWANSLVEMPKESRKCGSGTLEVGSQTMHTDLGWHSFTMKCMAVTGFIHWLYFKDSSNEK
ncbi:Rna/Rnp Complex-1-Interacting Phosphatase [Manis pentadactyla]|nr:Rna/Rnp Complex-1-Interacting Phosphatase [Manis pentadactyla]